MSHADGMHADSGEPTDDASSGDKKSSDIGFDNPAPPKDTKRVPVPNFDPDKTPPPTTPLGPIATGKGFGLSPMPEFTSVGFDGYKPVENVDDDDTPSGGVFIGGEEVQVIDAQALGRALAQAQGLPLEDAGPKIDELRKGLVGIDVGAAVAVIARFNEDGKHEIVPNAEDQLGTPAHVFFEEDGERLVGREALRLAPSAPDRAFIDAKARLGDAAFKVSVAGATVDAEELITVVARRLLEDAERRAGEKPTRAALAAPVWFTDAQRDSLKRAVGKAGVEVVGIADEPLAATVPYSLRLEDLNPRTAAIFDLGHSGLGCAIVRCARGDIEILKAEARKDLGATRFDEIIENEAAKHFKDKHGFDPRDDKGGAIDLRIRAEQAKKDLSQRTSVTLVVNARGKTHKVQFARAAFEDATKSLVAEACEFFRKVRDGAKVGEWSKVDAVIVTGGGTRMPMIRRAIKKETGIEPEKGNPDEGVAIGALYWGLFARSREGKPPIPAKKK